MLHMKLPTVATSLTFEVLLRATSCGSMLRAMSNSIEAGEPILSPGQEEAAEAILGAIQSGQRVCVLTGGPGTGKTFLMRILAERFENLGYKVEFMASTGRAAARVQEETGRPCTTIHTRLYKSVVSSNGVPVFLNPQAPCAPRSVLFCDEASMINEHLDTVIRSKLPWDAHLIYFGDGNQLPPVVGDFGPNFSAPTARLVDIHRQATQHAIPRIAADLLQGKPIPTHDILVGEGTSDAYAEYQYRTGRLADAAQWLVEHRRSGVDAQLLCWTNKTRQALNQLVRMHLGYLAKDGPTLVPGDRLMVLSNNPSLGVSNGEVLDVDRVVPLLDTGLSATWASYGIQPTPLELEGLQVSFTDGKRGFVQPSLLGVGNQEFREFTSRLRATAFREWLHVDYGQAMTYHKAQGSEYPVVGLVLDRMARKLAKADPNLARRLIYTGITRGKQQAVVWRIS